VAACVGLITIIASARVLREFSSLGGASYLIGICSGVLAFISLAGMGPHYPFLLLPWKAVGITLAALAVGSLCQWLRRLRLKDKQD
jgi:hypothetical protein